MTTITGKIEDAAGRAVHCAVTFVSKSTPVVSDGLVIGNTSYRKMSDTNGDFSVTLFAGKYAVTYATRPQSTSFEITVPETDSATMSIEEVTSSSLSFVFTAPNTVWNGQRAGHIKFIPIADPDSPGTTGIVYGGLGHQSTTETYKYKVTYETSEGESAPSVEVSATGVNNGATRITTESSPTRVTSKRIWRTIANDGTDFYLLTELDPAVTQYDDWESHADFADRIDQDILIPVFNTTAGVIYSSLADPILYFSSTGLRCLSTSLFDGESTFEKSVTINGTDSPLAFDVTGTSRIRETFIGNYYLNFGAVDQTTSYGRLRQGGFDFFNEAGEQKVVWAYSLDLGTGEITTTIPALSVTAFKLPTGAQDGYVLTSDGSGNASWSVGSAATIMYDDSGNAYSVGIEVVGGVPGYKAPVALPTRRKSVGGEGGGIITDEGGKTIIQE